MKELYERPSPSPTESIELIEKSQEVDFREKNTIESLAKIKDDEEILTKKETTESDVQAVQETSDNEVQASPTTLECETMTPIVDFKDFSVQKNVDCTEIGINTDEKPMTSVSVQSDELSKEDKLKEILEFLPELNDLDLARFITNAGQIIGNRQQ